MNNAEEEKQKIDGQNQELSQVLFAIDNVEKLCSVKKASHQTNLKYSSNVVEQNFKELYPSFTEFEKVAD